MKNILQLSSIFALTFSLLYVFWIIFVGSFAKHELLVGILAALLGAAGICIVEHAEHGHFRPRLRDWLEILRVPWYAVSGIWELLTVSVKDLLGIQRAGSYFRLVTFRGGELGDPHDTGRRVLAVTYTTMSPNSVVLGINVRDGFMLFHQVERSEVHQLDKDLGARP